MREHKFLILIGDCCHVHDDSNNDQNPISLKEEIDKIQSREDATMAVISCPHEKWEDNVITITYKVKMGVWDNENRKWSSEFTVHEEEVEVVREVDGTLWYFTEHMSKLDIIKSFE